MKQIKPFKKRGAFNYAADFGIATLLFVMLLLMMLLFSNCVKTKHQDEARIASMNVQDTRALPVLFNTPLIYENKQTTFADMFVSYYYADQIKDSKTKEKIKQFLQKETQNFVDRTGLGEKCWNLILVPSGDETILNLWGGECGSGFGSQKKCEETDKYVPIRFYTTYFTYLLQYQKAIVPLVRDSTHQNLEVCYATNIGVAPDTQIITAGQIQ